MTNVNNRAIAYAATIVLSLAIGSSFVDQKAKAVSGPATNSIDAKSLFQEKCSACHDAPDPVEKGFSKAEWISTVNRMLNAHNARTSISDDEAAQIIDYLGQFAPKPGSGGAPAYIGVWTTDPVLSLAFPFTYAPNLTNFEQHGGVWKVVETPDVYSGYLKHSSVRESPTILLEKKNSVSGSLDVEVQFRLLKQSDSSAIGLVFGETDSANYVCAEYSPTNNTVTLSKVTGGQTTKLAQQNVNNDSASPDGWHNLRVKVTEQGIKLEVLMDFQRQIQATIPGWNGGRVGLISSGPIIAGFRQLTIDSYSSSASSPAGDVLLH